MRILSRVDLKEAISEKINFYNVIAIGAAELELLGISNFCKECIFSLFDDVINPDLNRAPTLEHVENCIKWGLDKEDLLVSCAAGVSRSASIAYLIECAFSGDPEASTSVLDYRKHRPNQLILCYGNKILNMDVTSAICEYYKFAFDRDPKNISLKYYLHDLDVVIKKLC